MATLTDEERATRVTQLHTILEKIDTAITDLQTQRAPYAAALASLTDQDADYKVTLKHGDDRELVVVEHGTSPDDAARKAMQKHPGFTAQHAKTEAIPKDFPDLGELDGIPLGPTIEEFVRAGYKAEDYPPKGFLSVNSPGLTRFKAGQPVVLEPVTPQPEQAPQPASTAV